MYCAIGIYSQKLARAMVGVQEDLEVRILGEVGTADATDGRIISRPVYRRDEEYQDKIVKAAVDAGVQLVHFQHAPDLLGDDHRLPQTLKKLHEAGIKTVVTLHTVYSGREWRRLLGKWSDSRFHQGLAEHADRLIVHHRRGMADSLEAQGIEPGKLVVIPHGTTEMPQADHAESLRHLGLPEDTFLFLFFGFIHIQKNIHTVVEAFSRIARDYPRARLVVAGMPWGKRWYNHLYSAAMKTRVRLAGRQGQIEIRDAYVAPGDVNAYFSAADVLLLPHWQKYGSASGVFHQAIGARKPIIMAPGPKFADGMQRLAEFPELLASHSSPAQWAKAMRRLIEDDAFREKARHALSDYTDETLWPVVAGSHLKVYEELLGE
jgi:glycosyltransferase involved in cell wall biosynthesis